MRILVLGVTGMLGNAVFKSMSLDARYDVYGTLRKKELSSHFSESDQLNLVGPVDVLDLNNLTVVIDQIRPDVIINCVGLIKQLDNAKDPLIVLPINTLFPHRLAKLCEEREIRLVHISTDCVFNGRKGQYKEQDISDAEDLYGKSKYMGELHDKANAITLRTSIIGHELNSHDSLVDWFLSQSGQIKGYTKAIFSGLPTIELARVISDFVLPNKALSGLYHVSAEPIDKYSLLNLIADQYGKEIGIIADEQVQIDRSLNSEKFKQATGYFPPAWPELVAKMYHAQKGN